MLANPKINTIFEHEPRAFIKEGDKMMVEIENLKNKDYPLSISINCISVKEISTNVSNPVNWKLLTTHEVGTYQQALILVEWYCARWYIEQLFRLLKRKLR